MTRSLSHYSARQASVRAQSAWLRHPAYQALEFTRYRADCKGLKHGSPERAAFISADLWFAHEIRVMIARQHGAPL